MKIDALRALFPAATSWGAVRLGALAAALLPLALCAPASAAERSLAGIKIFSGSRTVLQKFKSPSRVIVGRPSLTPAGSTATPGATGAGSSGSPGGYPGAGGMGGAPGQLPGFGGGVPSEFGQAPGGGGGYNPMGAAPTSGAPGANGATTPDSNPGEVTWIYDRPNGGDLEFTFSSDGRVIQIRATGYTGTVKTTRGIALGTSYGNVVGKYGYPESQEQDGPILTAKYTESDHVAFQFFNQKLVAIIVAAVE